MGTHTSWISQKLLQGIVMNYCAIFALLLHFFFPELFGEVVCSSNETQRTTQRIHHYEA